MECHIPKEAQLKDEFESVTNRGSFASIIHNCENNDVVILVSNGGSPPEINAIRFHARETFQ